MAAFDRIIGKKKYPLEADWLHDQIASHRATSLDIGTGSGDYVSDLAAERPETLVIGLDPVAENMADASRKAAVSVKKGGRPNAHFIRGAAEMLPGPFAACADEISINYPWGSLMHIVAKPDVDELRKIAACGRPGARLAIYLNYNVLEDREYLTRLGFEDIADPLHSAALDSAYREAGFAPIEQRIFAGDPPFRSRWGRQLIRGSGRRTLIIETRLVG